MGLFKSRSHLEIIEDECQSLAEAAAQIRDRCDRSLRGKFQNMLPEDRAALLKEAAALERKLKASFATVQHHQQLMDAEETSSEARLAAQAKLVGAKLDVEKTSTSMGEARQSLAAGVAEIEQFYGARSPEAKHVRKVLEELARLDGK